MSLSDYFRRLADRRRRQAEEHPGDERCLQAARALDSLADYVDDGAQWPTLAALDPHLDEDTLGGAETWREVAQYGYGRDATSPHQHEELLEELAVRCVMDAYEFARRNDGEDPTDTLLAAELDAAADGVRLPSSYFERRGIRDEHELEQAIEHHRRELADRRAV